MATERYHLQEQKVPKGLMIFEPRLDVAGIQFHRNEAISFAENAENGWLEFEREPDNQHDKNALKLIGCRKTFFGTRRHFLGYVPEEIARLIAESGFSETIQPRLLKTYVSDNGFVEIQFQVLGPVGRKYQFRQTARKKPVKLGDFFEQAEQLVEEKKSAEAIEVLLKLVEVTEKEAQSTGHGVIPAYYDRLAMIYRKEKRYREEVEILERYASQPKAPGAKPKYLAECLVKAKQRLNDGEAEVR